jgi:hypothetical protein
VPLPNFFVIGAAKAGTTALWAALDQHPDVYMSPVKEPRFFALGGEDPVHTRPDQRRYQEPQEYLALFAGAGGQRAIGEASTFYLTSAMAARRIRRDVPSAKLVVVLRHPIDRAHSHYWHQVRAGHESAPTFEQALASEPRRVAAGLEPWRAYRERGLYHEQLSEYFSRFPREQIRVYLYEDWCASPSELLAGLFAFLDVDPAFAPMLERINASTAVRSVRLHRLALSSDQHWLRTLDRRYGAVPIPPVRPETRAALLEGYRDDIEKLQVLIDRDLTHWMANSSSGGVDH